MECSSDYVNNFLKYVDTFVANIRPDDPLPVRAPCYKVTETEIDGQILDIVYHYLNHRECPAYLRSVVAQRVWRAIRNPQANGKADDEGCDVIDHGNHTYEPMKLIQDVTSKANSIIRELQKSLSPSVIESLPRYLPVSQYAIKNTRRKMENRHVIIQDLNTLYDLDVRIFGHPHAYYAVFDGHGGSDAAVYSQALFHQYLIQNPFYETDPVQALKHAFSITDTNFAKRSEKERLKGGTTAVVALVREKRLVVAWLGDSLALLVRKRTPVQIVQPHKPDSISERKRIEQVGGCVVNIQGTWRVLGQLAVSRAIGDVKYKPYLSSECDIKSLEICGDEDFLILACDGLWDNLSPEKAVDIVYSYLLANEGDTDGVGRCLVEAARSSGSEDNITAIVVFLRPVNVLMEEERTRIDQGQVPEMESFVMTQKGALPPSINAIFSPPEHFNSSPVASKEVDTKDANGHPTPKEPSPMPLPVEDFPAPIPPDYDSDEGVGADLYVEKGLGSPEEAESKVTEEEVDAALAELDSIPDVGLEAGDVEAEVEDDDDEEEEWSFIKMEPQLVTNNEDLIVTGSSEVTVEPVPVMESDIHQASVETRQSPSSFIKETSPSGSPPAPGSPRTVEGFVTSVELNTPEESYNTNLAINQSTEYFNGGQIEQSSGPFSVYVSSSPEPASIESPPVNLNASMSSHSPAPVEEETESKLEKEEVHEPSVEIVHAQSTVEVIDSLSEVDLCKDDAGDQIPDIMTQSITGDLPTEPYILSTPEPSQISPVVEDMVHFTEESKSAYQTLLEETKHSVDQVAESYSEQFSTQSEFLSKESSHVTREIEESVAFSENKMETMSEKVTSFVETPVENTSDLEPVSTDVKELSPEEVSEEFERNFAQEVNRAFEAPMDQMIASFHEDRTQISDLICTSETTSQSLLTQEEHSTSKEIPTADLLEGIHEVESLTNQMSNLKVVEQVPEDEPASVPSPVPSPVPRVSTPPATKTEAKRPTPASAPRTSVSKTAPPKPSPRSVGSKPTSKLAPATSPASTGPSPGGARTALKRPTSLTTAATKPLKKPETARPLTTAKSRLSTTTSTARASSASATSRTTTTTKTASSSATARTRTTPTAPVKTTSAPPPRTRVPASSAPRTGLSGVKSRISTASTTTTTQSTTATRRPISATKPLTTTKVASTAASKVNVNGVASAASKTSTRTSAATAATTRKPLTTKTTTTTTTRMSSSAGPRKPLSTTTNTATKSPSSTAPTQKQRTVTSAPPATKDTKNTTNRMLSSTTRTSTTRTSSQPLSKTNVTAKTRSPLKTTKTPGGLKSEKAAAKSPAPAKIEDAAIANGENKIVEEESAVEVKEKIIQEESRVVEVHESAMETISSVVEDIVTMKQDKLLVNGDHS